MKAKAKKSNIQKLNKNYTMKTTIKEMLTVLALTICLILAGYAAGIAQTTQNFKGKDYQVQTGTRGGKYIVIETGEKIYLSSYVASKPELTNDTIATYKGKKYPIHTGS